MATCCAQGVLTPPQQFHPTFYSPSVAASIQRWGVSTLREQIHAGHVTKAAFYMDSSAVEVLDRNGIQRRVDLFPGADALLVKDLHEEHVDFFVAPEPTPSPLVPFAQGLLAMMIILFVMELLGMKQAFVFGLYIWGSAMIALADSCVEACAAGKEKHDAAVGALWQALTTGTPLEPERAGELVPVRVEEESNDPTRNLRG